MIPDIDIWRSPHVMMKRFGERAATEADERAGELIEKDDQDGAAVWCRIRDAIVQWEATGRQGPANRAGRNDGEGRRRMEQLLGRGDA